MLTVEELLGGLGSLVVSTRIKDEWHRSFIASVQQHVQNGSCLSTNQSTIILKACAKYPVDLSKVLRRSVQEVEDSIRNPSYKKEPYQSVSIKREVRYLGDNKLAFRFKLDNTVLQDIKNLRGNNDLVDERATFNEDYRIWVVSVTVTNYSKVFSIINRHKFDFDEGVLEYMTICNNTSKVKSTIVMEDDESLIYANICSNPILVELIKNTMNGEVV